MSKIFILDTNVFANDPYCFKSFPDNEIILPITVLEELDKIKSLPNEVGRNARVSIRELDKLFFSEVNSNGSSKIKLDNNSTLAIDVSQCGSLGQDASYGDNKILACAVKIQKENTNKQVIIVSRDINLRLRARAFNLLSENYDKEKKDTSDIYTGFKSIVEPYLGEKILRNEEADYDEKIVELHPNQFILIQDENGDNMCSARRVRDQLVFVRSETPWGLPMRNKEQLYAANLLMDRSVPLVSMIGLAGSGKTLVALASALEMVINKKMYSKVMIYRPIQPMGNELGFTPGTIEEKLAPWMGPVKDNLEFLMGGSKRKGKQNQSDSFLSDKLAQFADQIQMEALTYIRGRSICDAVIILDEFQNTSKEEIKTVLTRVGENTKIILSGDLAQIDTKNLDAINNGLTYAVEKFKSYDLAGHITFTKGERSALATLAAEIL